MVCIPRQTHLTPSTCEPDPQSFPLMAAEPWCVHIHQQKKNNNSYNIVWGLGLFCCLFFFEHLICARHCAQCFGA